MRLALPMILAVLAALNVRAADAPAADRADVWSGLAGFAREREAEALELRDELIAAHLNFTAALAEAAREAADMPATDSRHGAAWARVEYLLETSYRLLAETGEGAAFLSATETLRPQPAPEVPEVELTPPAGAATEESAAPATPEAPEAAEAAEAETETAETATPPAYVAAVKARAAWLRGLALERSGRGREMPAEAAGLGMIADWALLGPLDGDADSGAELANIIEDAIGGMDAAAVHQGKDGPVRWRAFASADALGRLPLSGLLRSPGAKSALAVALVHTARAGRAVLEFGTDGAAGVFVNGRPVGYSPMGGLTTPGQEARAVTLKQGWNAVLVRCFSGADEDGWTFALRLTTPDGRAYPGYIAKPTAGNLATFLAAARAAGSAAAAAPSETTSAGAALRPGARLTPGCIGVLVERVEADPADGRANFYLASILVQRRLMEGSGRFAREEMLRRAVESAPDEPYFTLMAARSVDAGLDGPDREENLRLVLLRRAADHGSAAALVDMGRLYLDVMRTPRRAAEFARAALGVNPMSLRAGVLEYDVAEAMGWGPVAGTLLDKLVQRHPAAPAALLRLGRRALAGGRNRSALTAFHAVLGSDAARREALDGAVVALGMLGQTSAAVDLVLSHMELFPYDSAVRLQLADLYRTLGRDDDAREVLAAALAAAPEDRAAREMLTDIFRETYAEGKAEETDSRAGSRLRQELDLAPARTPPPGGWEYIYFQTEDQMDRAGAINRTVSFAVKIYSTRAARLLRHLGFWLEKDFESGFVRRVALIHPDGSREPFSPPAGGDTGRLRFYLPPLRPGMAVEAEVEIRRGRLPFLGDYFGQIAPLAQQAPVRLSRYMFTAPADKRIFFRPVNGAPEAMVVASPDGEQVTRIWEMTDLPAFAPEPFSPGADELAPGVQASSFGDWDEFARWYWRLIGAQYHAPPELRELAARFGSPDMPALQRLDLAAAWVARTIGHREWEFGPYAFRPVNARSILSRLSADSKDRTLLVCLLAREYGLGAWPVLTRIRIGGPTPVGTRDFGLPLLDHFNYSLAVLDGPPGGPVFLDAANPYRPSGVMPSQLFGGRGVVITPQGAGDAVIPDGGVSACDWDETAELVVDDDGSILWEQSVRGAGTAAETLRMRFGGGRDADAAWTAFLLSQGGVPSAAAGEFAEDEETPAAAEWRGRARLRGYAAVTDGRAALTVPALPGIPARSGDGFAFPLSLSALAATSDRTQELVLPHGFRIVRRLSVRHPAGWRLVNAPEGLAREFPFGKAELLVNRQADGLALTFTMEVPGHGVAAADYQSFREMAALAGRWLRPELVWEKP